MNVLFHIKPWTDEEDQAFFCMLREMGPQLGNLHLQKQGVPTSEGYMSSAEATVGELSLDQIDMISSGEKNDFFAWENFES